MDPVESTQVELAQLRLQLHQVITAMQRQVGALDIALRTIEQTMTSLAESDALPEQLASEHSRVLCDVRGTIISTGALLQWRQHESLPPRS